MNVVPGGRIDFDSLGFDLCRRAIVESHSAVLLFYVLAPEKDLSGLTGSSRDAAVFEPCLDRTTMGRNAGFPQDGRRTRSTRCKPGYSCSSTRLTRASATKCEVTHFVVPRKLTVVVDHSC